MVFKKLTLLRYVAANASVFISSAVTSRTLELSPSLDVLLKHNVSNIAASRQNRTKDQAIAWPKHRKEEVTLQTEPHMDISTRTI
jgi:hypothetical protein